MSTRQNTIVLNDASIPFTNSGPKPHANTASATAQERQPDSPVLHGHASGRSPADCLTARQIRGYLLAMIEIPGGHARLRHPAPDPVEEQDVRRRLGVVGHAGRPGARHAHRRRARLLLRGGVRSHRDPRVAGRRPWAPTGRTASPRCRGWAALTERTTLLSHAYVLPYRHPLVAAKEFATLDYLTGGRAHRRHRRRPRRGRVRGARRRPRAARQARRGEAAAC